MTILARPSEWVRTSNATASPAKAAGGSHHYFAFLSYSHRNQPMADWLHQALERFVVPSHLVGRVTDHGPVPRRLTPIFRDLNELPASDDLGHEIRAAIAGSRFLVVLCSPAAARSRWTNAEIEVFKRVRPDGCVFAAIIDGEPFASDLPGREDEECLPKALRFKYDRRGRQTTTKAEPLAADLRGSGEVRRLGFLKLVAGMLGLGLDELVQRDTIRRQRRLAAVAGGSLVGMLVATGLAVTAIQGRDEARDQRREAEGLVGFMLGDLRAKLEPLGRLDTLDAVGARALAYYQSQDKGTLSDESLVQRSKALTLMGEIANARGNLDRALQLYREAYASTAEAVRRDGENPQRLFDHAQNVFWVGYIDRQQGKLPAAVAAMREYQRLAHVMVELEPDNPKYRLEQSYANNGLGVLLLEQRKFSEASRIFESELSASEALLASEPGNLTYQDRMLEAFAWLSDAREKLGAFDDAIAQRERQISLLQQLRAVRGDDAGLQRKLMTAERVLGRLFASRGEIQLGLEHMEKSKAIGEQLLSKEPGNTEWAQFASEGLLELGEIQLAIGRVDWAASSARSGCDLATRLAGRDESVSKWRVDLRGRCLELRARLALRRNSPAEAQALATAFLRLMEAEAGRARSVDAQMDLASALMLRGDVAARLGDSKGARAAWLAALSTWPAEGELKPRELTLKADLLRKTGQVAAANAIAGRLAGLGYREPYFRKV